MLFHHLIATLSFVSDQEKEDIYLMSLSMWSSWKKPCKPRMTQKQTKNNTKHSFESLREYVISLFTAKERIESGRLQSLIFLFAIMLFFFEFHILANRNTFAESNICRARWFVALHWMLACSKISHDYIRKWHRVQLFIFGLFVFSQFFYIYFFSDCLTHFLQWCI